MSSTVPQEMQDILRIGRTEPAPASQLLTNRQLRVELTHARWHGQSVTLLGLRDTTVRLLSVVSRAQDFPTHRTAYDWYPTAGRRCQASELDLAALEHLYRLALNGVVTDEYRFGMVEGERKVSGPSLTHAQLLARIAEARECVAAALTSAGAAPPKRWRTVALEPASSAQDKAIVSARLMSLGSPLAGATILFSRAPHLECSATTSSTGLATCKLEDTHGHDGHDDVPGIPTIASYPGDVKPDLIVLPTTSVERREGR